VSVLVLLTLQSSFLLPPFGYALDDGERRSERTRFIQPVVCARMATILVAQWLYDSCWYYSFRN